ncbi:MAG: hypothetical protein M4D80_04145 [Myxococcota bacterium]|nr:hypothetical protein [Myxococcota bacterium]
MATQNTLLVRKIPYRLPCFEDVTKRIDLFQLEQHLARSMERTEVMPVVVPDDDFDTRVTMPREVVLPPPPAVYPIKRQDPTDVLIAFILLAAISALLCVMIY